MGRITTKPIKARDLKPGDLFAIRAHWENRPDEWIFLHRESSPLNDSDDTVYLIEIEHEPTPATQKAIDQWLASRDAEITRLRTSITLFDELYQAALTLCDEISKHGTHQTWKGLLKVLKNIER
jgi:hypothetical protein